MIPRAEAKELLKINDVKLTTTKPDPTGAQRHCERNEVDVAVR
jgi:hypothetical protein